VGAAVAEAGLLLGDLAQAGAQGLVVWGPVGLVALGGAVLAGDPARPTLGEAEAVPERQDRLPPPGRAQTFPRATSLSASISSSLSATIRFSELFWRRVLAAA